MQNQINQDGNIKRLQLLISLFKGNCPQSMADLPQLHSGTFNVPPDSQRVAEFNQVVAWQNPDFLPPTWLQVSAFPVYLNLLSDPAFPFSPLGLVHVANQVNVLKPLPVHEQYQLSCTLGNYQAHNKGVLFDIRLEARVSDEIVYQGVATNLAMTKRPAEASAVEKSTAKTSEHHLEHTSELVNWQLGSDTGRRYARVSGDYNPIHLFPLSAKLFGFRRHIAHGMYLKALALSTLLQDSESLPSSAQITFRKPVLLPADVSLNTGKHDGSRRDFELACQEHLYAFGQINSRDA